MTHLFRLTLGHVYTKKDNILRPIKFCDFQIYQHGENGVPPVDYAFTFKTGKFKNSFIQMLTSNRIKYINIQKLF